MERIKIVLQIFLFAIFVSCDKYADFEEPPINRLTTENVVDIIGNSATSGGDIMLTTDLEVIERGVCWSKSNNPTISDQYTSDGNGTGNYISYITDLETNTTYNVRAFMKVKNNDVVYYGNEISFTTTDELYPIIKTRDVTNITSTTAICGGIVLHWGNPVITERGVCWNTSENPTVKNYYTRDGLDGGDYISEIKELTENTTYYVRAYAYCAETEKYFYGEQKIFITQN